MPHVTTKDGTDLYVKDWGLGRPIVLIHGWPLQADSWDDVAYALVEAGHRVIAYDRRGFGRSGQPWNGYDYDTLADDLAAVMEAAGVTDAAIAGFSMGGGEVARYLSRHGGRNVRQAALISSVVPGIIESANNPDGVDGSVLDGIKDGILKERPKFFADFFASFYGVGPISHPVHQATIDWTLQMAMQGSLKATLACVDAFGRTDFTPDLAAFTVPTLIVHGTADKTVPIDPTARRAAAAIASATLVEYDGAPHAIPATHKDRLIADLTAFLAR